MCLSVVWSRGGDCALDAVCAKSVQSDSQGWAGRSHGGTGGTAPPKAACSGGLNILKLEVIYKCTNHEAEDRTVNCLYKIRLLSSCSSELVWLRFDQNTGLLLIDWNPRGPNHQGGKSSYMKSWSRGPLSCQVVFVQLQSTASGKRLE